MTQKEGICGNYSAYVLRIWREPATGQLRGTLRNTLSGQRESFVSLPMLLDHLMKQSASGTAPPASEATTC